MSSQNFFPPRRGGGYRGGGGGYKPQQRRYWDNDDYGRRGDRRDDRNRRGRSRSSRSYSRSRSRSLSPVKHKSPSRSDHNSQSRHSDPASSSSNIHDKVNDVDIGRNAIKKESGWSSSNLPEEFLPRTESNGQAAELYEGLNLDLGNYQSSYPVKVKTEPEFQQLQFNLDNFQSPPAPNHGMNPGSQEKSSKKKKKKEEKKRKKKRSRRSSSSSSSSSSSDDSDDSRGKRKSNQSSDDSSDSSSDGDRKSKKDKKKSKDEKSKKKNEDKEVDGSGYPPGFQQAVLTQRAGYTNKMNLLGRELTRLQSKEDELKKSNADIRLLDENLALQVDIKGRIKAVEDLIERISNLLKNGKDMKAPPPPKISQGSSSGSVTQAVEPIRQTIAAHVQPVVRKTDIPTTFEYFDNGDHWCRICNVFPSTVEQMFHHFHSKEHLIQIEQLGIDDKPWRKRNMPKETKPKPSGAKKIPFRGIQFISPVQGWYCRLCNAWMGDTQSGTEHLDSDEHNSNYMAFLKEHSSWEERWNSDKNQTRIRLGLEPVYEPGQNREVTDDAGSAQSIRVQMRNTVKVEESQSDALISATRSAKDSAIVDEWMSKPQQPKLDIDTQKFAEILKKKKAEDDRPQKRSPPPAPSYDRREAESSKRNDFGDRVRDRDRDRRDSYGNRRNDRVELQFSGRDRDRDRYRGFGGRRRSRSRSRSRSRDRERYNNRRRSRDRTRSRSPRSRERDRVRDRDRDRDRSRNRDKGEKEAVKKLPMIGKMPIFKRPVVAGKEDKPDDNSESTSTPPSAPSFADSEYGTPFFGMKGGPGTDNPMTSAYESNYAVPAEIFTDEYGGTSGAYGYPTGSSSKEKEKESSFTSVSAVKKKEPEELKPPGDKEALPDDFQQALDIIYSGGGRPIRVPPPSVPPPSISVPPPGMSMQPPYSSGYPPMDSTFNTYSYGGQNSLSQSFEGYGPAGYEDLDDGPPGTSDSDSTYVPVPAVPPSYPPPPSTALAHTAPDPIAAKVDMDAAEIDMDDLRMLGIDADDTAAAGIR